MTSKNRMLRALTLGKPDRLPVTVHQWQQFHLDTYLGGMDALAASKHCGLDASIQYFEAMGQFWNLNAEKFLISTPEWREEIEIVKNDTVISPTPHREFCLPYDLQIHDALHGMGHRSTYQTCGGMMHITHLHRAYPG